MNRARWVCGKPLLVLLALVLGVHVWMLAAHDSQAIPHVAHEPATVAAPEGSGGSAHASGELDDAGVATALGLSAHGAATCMVALLALGLLPDSRARVRAALSLVSRLWGAQRFVGHVPSPARLLPITRPSRIEQGVQLLV